MRLGRRHVPWLRDARLPRGWIVMAISGTATVVLGLIGYVVVADAPLEEGAYSTVKLLLVDAGDPPNAVVRWARWCGVVFLAAALVQILYGLGRDRWQRLRLRRRVERLRGQVVIAGLGRYGTELARAFRAAGRDVVGVEPDPHAPGASQCREDGIPVLTADPTAAASLRAAGAARAAHVVIATGDDAGNLEVAAAAGRLAREARTAPTCLVHLDNLRLWSQLAARAVAQNRAGGPRLEFFNVAETAARVLLDAHPAFDLARAGERRPPHVLLVGLEGIGESLLLHMVNLWRSTGWAPEAPLAVTVAAPGASARIARLLERHPRLGEAAALEGADVAPDAPAIHRGELLAERAVDSVYVCLEREGDALAAGMALAACASRPAPSVVVVVADEQTGLAAALRDDPALEGAVAVFGLVNRALPPALLLRGTTEVIARAMHANYLRTERARGAPARPSLVAWEQLEERLREENRAFADRIGAKLERASCALVPDPLADPGAPGFAFTGDEVEALAMEEHEGWRTTRRRSRPDDRLDVPWEALDEVEREKDRAAVRGLPSMLAAAGFEIVRPPARPYRSTPAIVEPIAPLPSP